MSTECSNQSNDAIRLCNFPYRLVHGKPSKHSLTTRRKTSEEEIQEIQQHQNHFCSTNTFKKTNKIKCSSTMAIVAAAAGASKICKNLHLTISFAEPTTNLSKPHQIRPNQPRNPLHRRRILARKHDSGAGKPAPRIILAVGSTGGHVFPAIAIADELKSTNSGEIQIRFVGTESRLESKLVPESGYEIDTVDEIVLRQPVFLSPENAALPLKLLQSIWDCWRILGWFRPHVVVVAGGFPAVWVSAAAFLRGIPVAIQEQNAVPGLGNRVLAAIASRVFVGFADAAVFFSGSKCSVTGNPVRHVLRRFVSSSVARSHFFQRESHHGQVVLVLGGSLGDSSLNVAVLGMYFSMLSVHPDRYMIWQTGVEDFDEMDSLVRARHPRLFMTPFLHSMDLAYAAADLVVARSGGMTCSELLAMGKPSILIPSTESHQEKNAAFMSEAAGSRILEDDQLDSRTLEEIIDEILDDDNLMLEMREKALKADTPDAVSRISEAILSLVRI